MKYKLYTTSHKAWDGMFQAMFKAKTSIYLEMYILSNDTNRTHNFFSLLKEKSLSGVEVVVIADIYGSFNLKNDLVKELREAGVEFIFFSHWLRRTHRKILIIDNKTAFFGGVNIKESIRNWRDLQIKVEGNVVKLALKSFANAYRRCGGKKENILHFSYTPLSKKIKSWVMDNWPATNKLYSLNSYYLKKISEAKFSISIVTPYLLPPRWLLVALDDACRRGILIEIVIPKDTDIKSLNNINLINACRLANIGVKFYLTKTMNHAKLMLIDNQEVVVGSQNMDILSFGVNFEAGIFSRQAKLVSDIRAIVDKWKDEAEMLSVNDRKLGFFNKILFHFYKIFYPIF